MVLLQHAKPNQVLIQIKQRLVALSDHFNPPFAIFTAIWASACAASALPRGRRPHRLGERAYLFPAARCR